MNRNRQPKSRLSTLHLASSFVAATALFFTAGTAHASDWKWSVTPYAWATDVGVRVDVDDRSVVDETISIADLMEDLDTIAQVRVEAQNGVHGVYLDLFDVTLSDDATTVTLPHGGTATFSPEMGMTIAELAGLFDPRGDQQGWQLLYGARILNQRAEIDATFDPVAAPAIDRRYDIDDSMVDALLGIRFIHRFDSRWSIAAKADLSAGGTDLSWSTGATAGYTLGETGRYTVTAGYRYMDVDFATAEKVEAEMTLSGFVAGLRIAF